MNAKRISIKKLNSEKELHWEKIREINKELDQREYDSKLPTLKKKYEGKFFHWTGFKPKAPDDNVFIYCWKVINPHEAIVNIIKFYPNGGFETQQQVERGFFMMKNEITKDQYLSAVNNALNILGKISVI